MSPLSIIMLSPVWIRREICTDQALFTSKNSLKQLQTNIIVDFDVRSILIWEESLLWITNYFCQSQQFTVKMSWWICFLQPRSFSTEKTFIDRLEFCGLLVDYCDVLIRCLTSFWRHPFSAEDPLVSKWCNAKFLQTKSVLKQTHLHLGWPEYVLKKYILFIIPL